jgi:hypothetical protein
MLSSSGYKFENKWDIMSSSKTQIVFFSFLDKVLCSEEKQLAVIKYKFQVS